MNKTKILIQGLSLNLGGIERYIYELVASLDKKNFEISFLVFDYGKDVCYENEFQKMGYKFFKITPRKKNYFKYINDLTSIFRNNTFDIIHFNIMDLSGFERIYLAQKYNSAKIIVHAHCGNKNYINSKGIVTKILDRIGFYVINKKNYIAAACSESAKLYFKGKDCYLLKNGIDYSMYKYSCKNREEIRKKYNIKDDEIVFGYVAALLPVKNHEFLLKVFKNLYNKNQKYKLLLIGDGPLRKDLIKDINVYDINNNVILTGSKSDIEKYYSSMDAFIMPSQSESFGLVLVEAQINGLFCFASDGVDSSSNISDNIKYVSLKKNANDWAKIIQNTNFQRKNPESIIINKKYDKSTVFQDVINLYDKIILQNSASIKKDGEFK